MDKIQLNNANIFGFDSKIHNLLPFHSNTIKECWGSKLEKYVSLKDEIIFCFLNNGDKYEVILKSENNKGDYKGRVICDGEALGFCHYRLFESSNRSMLWGDWNENGSNWVSLIEVFWK
jgi:hypothetical protein